MIKVSDNSNKIYTDTFYFIGWPKNDFNGNFYYWFFCSGKFRGMILFWKLFLINQSVPLYKNVKMLKKYSKCHPSPQFLMKVWEHCRLVAHCDWNINHTLQVESHLQGNIRSVRLQGWRKCTYPIHIWFISYEPQKSIGEYQKPCDFFLLTRSWAISDLCHMGGKNRNWVTWTMQCKCGLCVTHDNALEQGCQIPFLEGRSPA